MLLIFAPRFSVIPHFAEFRLIFINVLGIILLTFYNGRGITRYEKIRLSSGWRRAFSAVFAKFKAVR